MSLQEEQARQAAQAQPGPDPAKTPAAPASTPKPTTISPPPETLTADVAVPERKDVEMNDGAAAGGDPDEDMDEEEAIARAIAMSMNNGKENPESKK
jgi:26S proteasome regulatory subunit N10